MKRYNKVITWGDKISKAKMGHLVSLDTRQKLREKNLGRKLSEETKIKISKSLKGKKRPKYVKLKISESHKGIKHSEETKEKIRQLNIAGIIGGKGKKCNLWKGGITPKNKIIREGIEFRLWREAVFARDNWTCQKYKIQNEKLNSHHIQNFSQYPELFMSNLCYNVSI